MRNRFDRQLVTLNEDLIQMGGLIERAIAGATTAITKNDKKLAKEVILLDDEVNHAERDIEALCLKLLLQQQPVAKDLRLISAALKMITDMERIGDQASDMCEIALTSKVIGDAVLPEYISQMAREVIQMVNESINAFVKKDLVLAQSVTEADEKVDNLFDQVKNDLIDSIRNNAKGDEQAIDILMIAKYLEKIGDHACNIAEWVIFSITGQHE